MYHVDFKQGGKLSQLLIKQKYITLSVGIISQEVGMAETKEQTNLQWLDNAQSLRLHGYAIVSANREAKGTEAIQPSSASANK